MKRGLTCGQVQIGRVEVACIGQSLPITDCHGSVPTANQTFLFKRLEGSVYMDWSEANRIGQLLLGHGELVVRVLPQAGDFKPQGKLAQQVSDAGMGIPPPDIRNPFPEDGGIDERVLPHRHAEARMIERELPHVVARDQRDLAIGEHLHAVVCDSEDRVL